MFLQVFYYAYIFENVNYNIVNIYVSYMKI